MRDDLIDDTDLEGYDADEDAVLFVCTLIVLLILFTLWLSL